MRSTPFLLATASAVSLTALLLSQTTRASDPGPRPGPVAAGGAIAGLGGDEMVYFQNGLHIFQSVDSVQGTIPGTDRGLGPGYNLDSCGGCHAHPAPGGSSPAVNPQIAAASREGAVNTVPFFVRPDGPVVEARFKRNPDGSPDGGVHALFTVAGRSDAPGCTLAQPDFQRAADRNNLSLRIPTPVFGAGLIEAIPDEAIRANQAADFRAKRMLGISGHANTNGNDGTITRFGWKAQNKSLALFAAEAYAVEQGVTNEMFPNERLTAPGCSINGTPESTTNFDAVDPARAPSDAAQFSTFMRFLAPPAPAPDTASTARGRAVFREVGCAYCHTPSLATGRSSSPALTGQAVNLYSDLLVHQMGVRLADGITQGAAGPDAFRTAPLWGLGQRLFFLHDGRTSDLVEAIRLHASDPGRDESRWYPASEANRVVSRFAALSEAQKQDLLNFLRNL